MAAAVGADSDNFLRSSLSKENVLVVGDGNFSFSLSLAVFRDEHRLNTPLVLTSFDNKNILEQDEFARDNLERLKEYENVEILHNVDATKLSEYFSTRKFGRIIFNFPHTGGKSNIKNCRKLLEDFFMSAVEHVELYDGDVCVTLCKGQGGTPVDEPQRAHGNSWQIVNNAAKAGLILNQLYPFLDSDYSHYKSVGHRGRLTKGFHTTGGLIHIFTPGVRLDPIEDFSGKTMDSLLTYICKHYDGVLNNAWRIASGNPLRDLTNEILSMSNGVDGTSFEEILENIVTSENLQAENGGTSSGFEGEAMIRVSHNNRILSAINKSSSFVLSAAALPKLEEVTDESNISMRYLMIGRSYESGHEGELKKADVEKQEMLDKLKNLFSNEREYVHEVNSHEVTSAEDLKISAWTNSSEVAHLARKKCQVERKVEKSSNHCQARCTCETLCRRYLRNAAPIKSAQRIPVGFLEQNTVKVFKKRSTVVIICGCLQQEVLKAMGYRHGWLIFINMDVLAMVQHNIPDVRVLSSTLLKWERKEDRLDQRAAFIPGSKNLFPPEHVHDISFWISDDVSQELFFLTTMAFTKNCVKEIKLTEIYHDEDKHCVSFNYRMVYSRVDGPLSHLEAVELQNRLRRVLLVLGFGLK